MAKLGPGHGRNLLRSYNATLILCLLSEGPAYGAQLAKVISERSRGYFKLKEGTLYPALHRMENDELIQEAPAIVGCRTPSALAHRS